MLNEHLCVLSIAINGIIYNLKGLRMYTNQLVCWHLINMGSPRDFHSVHFHGQTFLHKKATSYRHAVYPLLPGEHLSVCEIRVKSFFQLFIRSHAAQYLPQNSVEEDNVYWLTSVSLYTQGALLLWRCVQPNLACGSWRQKLDSTSRTACKPSS